MDDNKAFDQYIKGLFDENPEVPSELNWEAMDFNLPTSNKKSKRTKFWFRSIICVSVLLALHFCRRPFIKTIGTPTTEIIAQENLNVETNNINTLIVEEESKPRITNINTKTTNNQKKDKHISSKTTPQTFIKLEEKNLNTKIAKAESRTTIVLEEEEEKLMVKKGEIYDDIIQHKNEYSTELLPSLPIHALAYSTKVKLFKERKETDYKINNPRFPIEQIFVGLGTNNFVLQVDDTNILKDKINKVLGQTYQIGARIGINNHWKAKLALQYHQFHTTFEHTRDLEPELDIANLLITNRQEITFHNNYTNSLGIQIGLERKFDFLSFLDIYGGLGLMPMYTTATIGKTTREEEVETLVFDESQTAPFSLSGALQLGLIMSLNSAMNVELSYSNNRFLIGDIFINNGITTNRQMNMQLIFSYNFGKMN